MDTIVALSTPAGRGALGVVRMSGPEAPGIIQSLAGRPSPFPDRHPTLTRIDTTRGHGRPSRAASHAGGDGLPASATSATGIRDQAVVTVFAAPRSYTGEDMVEISCHGSPVVIEAVLLAAIDRGARLAEPGEFTLRAFLHGRLDLAQAEAVADLVNAVTPRQATTAFAQLEGSVTEAIAAIDRALFDLAARLEASLDFPDEGYHFVNAAEAARELGEVAAQIDRLLATGARGRLLREGAVVAIAGRPNVGKSSLFNTLLQANRAIVSATPGTTRDLLTERADIGGVPVRLVDTAGLRETADEVEREGVARARGAVASADVTVVVLDRSRALDEEDRALLDATGSEARVVVVNKIDLPAAWTDDAAGGGARPAAVAVSLKTGQGVEALVEGLARALGAGPETASPAVVTNVRHLTLLEEARVSVARSLEAIAESNETISEEFVLVDLQEARAALEAITGRRSSEDLLRHIFESFCIGK
ncbi:MAG: tRNA uridine-5-carboxymethylaminomethyl(34) synthesis GTPase MnmE [Vicinamibacterales bacterium]|nr:tRNA uridine-5-carboxymethylaminomethyl(34) synthesis GTPase MnmE [Vicinamibacterales bacterium]